MTTDDDGVAPNAERSMALGDATSPAEADVSGGDATHLLHVDEPQDDDFRCIVQCPVGVTVARFTASGDWYADGWDAARVAAFTSDAAERWRVEQIVNGDVNSLDDEQVQTIEAASAFFALLARVDRHEPVSVDEMTAAIARLGRSANGVIAESIWLE